jgi:hypothetical protein
VFVDEIAVKMAPRKLEKELRKEEKVKKAITIEKKEIVQKYESGRFGTHYGYIHCFLWKNSLDLRPT